MAADTAIPALRSSRRSMDIVSSFSRHNGAKAEAASLAAVL
jgi:hypothetical protein